MKSGKNRTFKRRLLAFFFGWSIRVFLALLFSTCRVKEFGGEILQRHQEQNPGKGLLTATWHSRIGYFLRRFGHQKFVVLASASKDGELAAQAALRHGFIVVRGSSSYRGHEALREMVHYFKQGYMGGMLVDAPKGPAQVSKIGMILASRLTGLPLVPVMWSASPCWRLPTWDRTVIPKPFARIVIAFGENSIQVPRNADRKDCEMYRRRLDEALNRLVAQTERFFLNPDVEDPRTIVVPDSELHFD